jgi:ABC-2 type transport system ATP-binding protein
MQTQTQTVPSSNGVLEFSAGAGQVATVPALQVTDLCVGYRKGLFSAPRLAVENLSLSVMPGETVGFLGPNGAGKSSTIKALMGFLAPVSGTARIFGHAAGSTQAKAKTGYLPEVALYYPFLTPMETLRLYGRLQGLGGRELETEAKTLLARVGLEGRENHQLKTFSKGMQQRLGVAQALLGSPDLLILDEVTSGLDPLGRRELRKLLHEVKAQGTTIFFSSHELDEVAQLCDRVVMIARGRVVDERVMDASLFHHSSSALEDYFIQTLEGAKR